MFVKLDTECSIPSDNEFVDLNLDSDDNDSTIVDEDELGEFIFDEDLRIEIAYDRSVQLTDNTNYKVLSTVPGDGRSKKFSTRIFSDGSMKQSGDYDSKERPNRCWIMTSSVVLGEHDSKTDFTEVVWMYSFRVDPTVWAKRKEVMNGTV